MLVINTRLPQPTTFGDSAMTDIRKRRVRSKHCPNDITDEPGPKDRRDGKCMGCAWGFVTPNGRGTGEDAQHLTLTPLMDGDSRAGYESHCGTVALSVDNLGRVGAERDGRFFPVDSERPAAQRFMRSKPHLFQTTPVAA